MVYTVDFVDNEQYGADDINGIRNLLATKGVIYEDEDSLEVSLNGSTVKIKEGQALFEDGCRLKISEEATLNLIPSVKNYVFLQRNLITNTPQPVVSSTAPTSADIPLAEIDGTVENKREFSTLKLPLMQGNHTTETSVTVNKSVRGAANELSELFTITLDYLGYNYMTIFENYEHAEGGYWSYGNLNLNTMHGFSFVRLTPYNLQQYKNTNNTSGRIFIRNDGILQFEKSGNQLICYFTRTNSYSVSFSNRTFSIQLY